MVAYGASDPSTKSHTGVFPDSSLATLLLTIRSFCGHCNSNASKYGPLAANNTCSCNDRVKAASFTICRNLLIKEKGEKEEEKIIL